MDKEKKNHLHFYLILAYVANQGQNKLQNQIYNLVFDDLWIPCFLHEITHLAQLKKKEKKDRICDAKLTYKVNTTFNIYTIKN